MTIAVIAAVLIALTLGMSIGRYLAEKSAVLHADCSTSHHMAGGFYYIVPESEYVKMRLDKWSLENQQAAKRRTAQEID